MLAGNIQIDDDLESYNKIADIIDISGGLETSGLKDISKIDISSGLEDNPGVKSSKKVSDFLLKVKKL